jgi:anti-anti-sigma regulatory factor
MKFITYKNRTFKLSGKINIYKASEIRRIFLKHYQNEPSKDGDIFIDLSKTELVDSSFLQILISFQKSLSKENINLKIKKSCTAFDSLLDLFQIPHDFLERCKKGERGELQ